VASNVVGPVCRVAVVSHATPCSSMSGADRAGAMSLCAHGCICHWRMVQGGKTRVLSTHCGDTCHPGVGHERFETDSSTMATRTHTCAHQTNGVSRDLCMSALMVTRNVITDYGYIIEPDSFSHGRCPMHKDHFPFGRRVVSCCFDRRPDLRQPPCPLLAAHR